MSNKEVMADDRYDQPQYNGKSTTFYAQGKTKGAKMKAESDDDGLAIRPWLTWDNEEGEKIRKTPRGIDHDGVTTVKGLTHVQAEVISPLSDKVIIRHHSDGSTERFICDKCVEYVRKHAKKQAMDPSYFWGAGVYHYETQKTPEGTMAYMTRDAMSRFIKYLPYEKKNNWEEITGLPFPYLFMKD